MSTVYGVEAAEETNGDVIQCAACLKLFSCDRSLKRHHERFPVCKEWEGGSESLGVQQSIVEYVDDLLARTIAESDGKTCRFCGTTFSSKGNLHKHFTSAVACNRRAHAEFKKIM